MISNKILIGIMHDFKKYFQFKSSDESKNFEKLVNYVTLSKYDPESFNDLSVFDFVDVDKSGTYGIDTFALFINDTLISSKDMISDFAKLKSLDARIVFIQTKSSNSFDSGEFLKFTSAIKNFFSPNPDIKYSDELLIAKDLYDGLLTPEYARILSKKKPSCDIYFATSGDRTDVNSISGVIKQQESEIKNANPELDSVNIKFIDSDYIIDSYNEIENSSSVNIRFEKNINCGTIEGVMQSFIGYLPIDEFLKLITGADGNIRKNLFYENVRDFQGGDNQVNLEIASTLEDEKKIDKFLLLNNGITVVAREFTNTLSSNYDISDYYIVNGCQTSNVLFKCSPGIVDRSKLFVPIKIVHTNDNNVISSLIKSTNRQTPVPDEAFLSLEKFHKRLQEYYKRYSQSCFETLYYERRSKEFSNSFERVEKPRIINLHGQIRSFTSIILGEPQLAMSNNPTSILKSHSEKMFKEEHIYTPYFLSSLLLYIFYSYTEAGYISKEYNVSRYWVCWIVRVLIFKSLDIGPMNSNKTETKCDRVIDRLKDGNYALEQFKKAIMLFDKAKKEHVTLHGHETNTQIVRLNSFKEIVKRNLIQAIH